MLHTYIYVGNFSILFEQSSWDFYLESWIGDFFHMGGYLMIIILEGEKIYDVWCDFLSI